MHELSVMKNILDIVLEYALKNNAGKVIKINLEVGELSDLIPDWMQMYFDFVSKDTIADNAELIVDKKPALLKCRNCSNEFTISREQMQFYCPECESPDIEIMQGREFRVVSIEVE